MPLPHDPAAPRDFDFIHGDWAVRHRRLDARLSGCERWTEFAGLSSTRPTLGGFGNVEDNLLHLPDGDVRALAMRAYDRATRRWSIWWLDARQPHRLDVPVVGGFGDDGIGRFYAADAHDGRPIRVRFTWTPNPGDDPTWAQAWSADGGTTWETNWTMVFTRRAG